MAWRTGVQTSLDIATPPPPPIPFNAGRPVQHTPMPLSFGFGCGSATAAPAPVLDPMPGPSAWRTPDAFAGRTSMPKRRRSSVDVEEPVEVHADADEEMASSPTLAKRRRASHGRYETDGGARVHAPARTPRRNAPQGAEVGKLLASLDKPALLAILHQLMSRSDALADDIYTLLPTPSLESVEHALDAAEARIRHAIPMAPLSAAHVRDQYVWSRVRTSLGELASDVRGYVALFSLNPDASQRDAREHEPMHPATTFSFLHATTLRMLRIARMLPHDDQNGPTEKKGDTLDALYASALPPRALAADAPNTIATTILPALLREWEHWLRAVDHAVNQAGRMYGQEVVVGWERGLASLGTHSAVLGAARTPEEAALRSVMNHAAQRMHSALGWLAGPAHRPAWSFGVHAHAMDAV